MKSLLKKLLPVFVKAAFTGDNLKKSGTTRGAAAIALMGVTAFATMEELIVGIGLMVISTVLFFLNDMPK